MNRKNGLEGFTLIEVLIALVVLSIGMAAMIPMLLHSVRGNSFGKATTQAATLSQDLLERLRSEPYLVNVAGTWTRNPDLTDGPHPDASPLPDGFTRRWDIQEYSADEIGIEVSTVWTDAQGTPHPSRVFTVRANP